jgi:putative hemolysin
MIFLKPPSKRSLKGERSRKANATISFILGVSFMLLWLLSDRGLSQNRASLFEMPEGSAGGIIAVLGVVFFIVLNGLFIAAEIAVEGLKPLHLKLMKDGDSRQMQKLQRLLDRRQRGIAACTFGSQISRIGMFLVGLIPAVHLAPQLQGYSADQASLYLLLASVLVWVPILLLNLVFGELVPKSYASLHPHRTGIILYRFILMNSTLLAGPANMVTAVAGLLTARFGGKASFAIPNQVEEEIRHIVESAEETEIESDEKEMLHSVFEFSDTVAREVMTPRVYMDAIAVSAEAKEVIDLIQKSGHSRIPLYEDTDDQIIGIVHAKDLLMAASNGTGKVNLRKLMRPALFVPENKNLHELLSEMRSGRSQMAVVQDEFGGTAGIVTVEDIVEELVGDIQDEYDREEPEIIEAENGLSVDGKTHVDDVSEKLGIELESDEFDTIGGYVFGLFGRQPKVLESIVAHEHKFIVSESDGRRILRLQIEKLPRAEFGLAEEA